MHHGLDGTTAEPTVLERIQSLTMRDGCTFIFAVMFFCVFGKFLFTEQLCSFPSCVPSCPPEFSVWWTSILVFLLCLPTHLFLFSCVPLCTSHVSSSRFWTFDRSCFVLTVLWGSTGAKLSLRIHTFFGFFSFFKSSCLRSSCADFNSFIHSNTPFTLTAHS